MSDKSESGPSLAPIALSTSQSFEKERFSRAIKDTSDPAALRGLALQLLEVWFVQKAAVRWILANPPTRRATVTPESLLEAPDEQA